MTPEQDNGSAEKNPKELMGYQEKPQAVKYRLRKHEELSVSIYNPGAVEAETGGSLQLTVQPAN